MRRWSCARPSADLQVTSDGDESEEPWVDVMAMLLSHSDKELCHTSSEVLVGVGL